MELQLTGMTEPLDKETFQRPAALRTFRGSFFWRQGLPVLKAAGLTLRELTLSDAPSLLPHLTAADVQRYLATPPASVEGLERFVRWTHRERAAGRYLCYGVVPEGREHPVGIIQVRAVEPQFRVVELGMALGSSYWGTGLFVDAARLFLGFAFKTLGAHRVEGRAVTTNERANAAIRKIGAVQEGVLRSCFQIHGEFVDHVMWSLLADDWGGRTPMHPRWSEEGAASADADPPSGRQSF